MKTLIRFGISTIMASIMFMNSGTINTFAQDSRDNWKGGFNDINDQNGASAYEIYDNLYRNANYRLYDNGTIYKAGARHGNNFYVTDHYQYCGSGCSVREIIDTTGQRIQLSYASPLYSQPFAENEFYQGELNAGSYEVVNQSLDFYEVKLNDSTGWVMANPGVASVTGTKQTLNKSSLSGIPLYTKIPDVGYYIRTGIGMKPKYITIHNTANEGYGANAESHANYLYTGESRQDPTSWHFTVDNNEIWQSIPMNESAYHAGDGYGMGNTSTIAIEIAENADGNYQEAEKNAAVLTAYLLKENGLSTDAIRMHKDWSGKHCAHNILDGTKGSMGWDGFKAEVKRVYDSLSVNDVQSIRVNPTSATLSVGKGFTIKTIISPASAKTDLTYSSSNNKVVSVDENGKVTAIGSGTATVTVKSENGKTATSTIKVIPQPEKISTNPTSATLSVYNGFYIKSFISPSNANQAVTYSSNNPSVASVNTYGYVRGIAPGKATITVTTANGKTANIKITVVPKMTLNPSSAGIYAGSSFKAKTIIYPQSLLSTVRYSTSDSRILTVDQKGNVTGKKAGSAYLYASAGGNSTKTLVTVYPSKAEKVTINPSSATVRVNSIFKAKGYVQPSSADQSITYKTSSPSIATIDKDGTVHAISPGYTWIVAYAKNGIYGKTLLRVLP